MGQSCSKIELCRVHIIQLCYGIVHGRVFNAELYALSEVNLPPVVVRSGCLNQYHSFDKTINSCTVSCSYYADVMV